MEGDAGSTYDTARVFRVTVRGRFRDLSDAARQYLVRAQPEHDIFVSAYTVEGTFTYDKPVQFFNLRYEVRLIDADVAGDDPAAVAATTAELEAEQFLRTMGFGHHPLKVDVVDMAAMWNSVRVKPAAGAAPRRPDA